MSWGATRFHDALGAKNRKQYREATSTHHRKPRSIGGTNDPANLSELPRSRHAAWHTLFQNFDAERIAVEINTRYLDPEYVMVAERRNHDASRTDGVQPALRIA